MLPPSLPVQTSDQLPAATTVVVIGGGIVGLSAALTLAERGIPVTLLEKGRLGGEQSSRNLGWVRKTNRLAADIPLAQAADRLWAGLAERTGQDAGYRQAGILFAARTPEQLAAYESWFKSTAGLDLDSRLLSGEEVAAKVPGSSSSWQGGVYTASDGRAEPTRANSVIATAAMAKGAVILENCAVRSLSLSGGRVSGVHTEQGEIRCEQVLLAAGAWSRRFLGNLNLSLPTLPLICSVLHTTALEGPTDIAVGTPEFSFRKHPDGGFIIMNRAGIGAPLTWDHVLLFRHYLSSLFAERGNLRISLGGFFFRDLFSARHWRADQTTPFEKSRTLDPPANAKLLGEAFARLQATWPAFQQAREQNSWAGVIDNTPDSNPLIGAVRKIPGLTLATGFSGHGFGTGPASGQLAADLVSGAKPLVDPSPYRPERFAEFA